MRVFIARHALTNRNEKRRMQEHDTPLSKRGEQQAKKLANRLKRERLTHIYTSPCLRAKQTARTIAKHHPGAQIITEKEIREKDYGEFAGKDIKEYVEWVKKKQEEKPWGTIKDGGGESTKDVQDRMISFFELLKSVDAKNVLIISHGSCCTTLLMSLQETPFTEEHYKKSFHRPATLSVLEVNEDEHAIEKIACGAHLRTRKHQRPKKQVRQRAPRKKQNTTRDTKR